MRFQETVALFDGRRCFPCGRKRDPGADHAGRERHACLLAGCDLWLAPSKPVPTGWIYGRPVSTASKPGAQMATARCPGQRPPAPDPGGTVVPYPVIGTKAERRAARERVSAYHQAQLAELLSHVAAAIDRYRDGEINACTVDETIHHYHLAATQLWKFCFARGGGTHAEFIAGILDRMTADA